MCEFIASYNVVIRFHENVHMFAFYSLIDKSIVNFLIVLTYCDILGVLHQ